MSSRQRGMKPQSKDAGGRKSEQHPNHPQPKPSSVDVQQESDSTTINVHAGTDRQPSQILVCEESAITAAAPSSPSSLTNFITTTDLFTDKLCNDHRSVH